LERIEAALEDNVPPKETEKYDDEANPKKRKQDRTIESTRPKKRGRPKKHRKSETPASQPQIVADNIDEFFAFMDTHVWEFTEDDARVIFFKQIADIFREWWARLQKPAEDNSPKFKAKIRSPSHQRVERQRVQHQDTSFNRLLFGQGIL
jgi:hypothetical protein